MGLQPLPRIVVLVGPQRAPAVRRLLNGRNMFAPRGVAPTVGRARGVGAGPAGPGPARRPIDLKLDFLRSAR